MVFLLPLLLLLLMAFLLYSEILVPTLRDAICTHRLFDEGLASAFLLLNCVIVTIIASSKLESYRKGGKEEGKESGVMMIRAKGDAIGGALVEGIIKQSYISSTCYDHIVNKENNMNHERNMQAYRLVYCKLGSHIDRVGLSRNRDLKEKKGVLARSSFSCNDLGMVGATQMFSQHAHLNANRNLAQPKCKEVQHSLIQAQDTSPAAAAHEAPSLEEVWAAIISNKTANEDHMPCMQSFNQRIIKTKYGNNDDHESAAAIAAAPSIASTATTTAILPATASETKEMNDPDSEVEELNRRAEEFIARFNQQMRLQRQESLQRKRQRRRHHCNDHAHRYMQLTPLAAGLLV